VSEGIFGECELFKETATGHRPPTENVIASVAGSDMEDLPIWYVPGTPPVDPPVDPVDPDCVKLSPIEKQIIDLIRQKEAEVAAGREKAIDWMKLIPLILEIFRLIQEGRAAG
jgi:hypothetical protein